MVNITSGIFVLSTLYILFGLPDENNRLRIHLWYIRLRWQIKNWMANEKRY